MKNFLLVFLLLSYMAIIVNSQFCFFFPPAKSFCQFLCNECNKNEGCLFGDPLCLPAIGACSALTCGCSS